MSKSLNMNYVNCALIVVVLVLVVMCCMNKTNEGFKNKRSCTAKLAKAKAKKEEECNLKINDHKILHKNDLDTAAAECEAILAKKEDDCNLKIKEVKSLHKNDLAAAASDPRSAAMRAREFASGVMSRETAERRYTNGRTPHPVDAWVR